MALTLNQIKNRLESLSLSHRQINNFYFGDPWEFDANGDIKYPACFVEQMPGEIDRTNKQQRFNFRIYLYDLVSVAENTEGNETEVLSDMTQVASDLVAMMMNATFQDDWQIVESIPITPQTEKLNDMTAGVFMEVGILIDWLADSCALPEDGVTFITEFDMARTRLFEYVASGSEGNSWIVPLLAGRNIIAVFRAGMFKKPIVTTPADDERIKVTGIDLGTNKGILSTTGEVQLNTGDIPGNLEKFEFLYYG